MPAPPYTDRCFVGMLNGYRRSGGLARAEELLAPWRSHGNPQLAPLARSIARREVIAFEWQSEIWCPLFQFRRDDLSPEPTVRQVNAELSAVFDAWDVAHWFASPNAWLGGHSPVDALARDGAAVLAAARADRYGAAG